MGYIIYTDNEILDLALVVEMYLVIHMMHGKICEHVNVLLHGMFTIQLTHKKYFSYTSVFIISYAHHVA